MLVFFICQRQQSGRCPGCTYINSTRATASDSDTFTRVCFDILFCVAKAGSRSHYVPFLATSIFAT